MSATDADAAATRPASATSAAAASAASAAATAAARADIIQYLPHREPFLFVDSVEVEGNLIHASRRFPPQEFFFAGHFPGYPVVPGVILLESMFQCGGVGVRKMGIAEAGTFFLAKIKEARFRRQVRPDEVYRMEIENIKATPNIVHQRGRGYVGDEFAVEAEWISIAAGSGGPGGGK